MRDGGGALFLLILLFGSSVAAAAAANLSPWAFEPVPDEPAHWLATWPGVHGVLSVRADNMSTVINRLRVETLLPGHDRITGLAACREGRDLLVYVTSYDDHRVWRYQLDGESGAVRGQLQMLSPHNPRAVLALDGCRQICVSGSDAHDTHRRVVQCYRVDRALDDDGVSIDEWWVMVSAYQWPRADGDDGATPSPESLLHDPHATALEASPSGSLWIDTKTQRRLVRFAVDSQTGVHFPDEYPLPGALSAQRLDWAAGTLGVADSEDTAVLDWSDTGLLGWTSLDGPHQLSDHEEALRVIAWRYAGLGAFDRLALADDRSTVIEMSFNRLAEAIAIGEVSASPSNSPTPTPTTTPSETPTRTSQPSPSPSVTPMPTVPVYAPGVESKESGGGGGDKHGHDELWALTTLLVPCACVPIVLFVMYRKRHRLGRPWRRGGGDLKSMELHDAGGGDDEQPLSPDAGWYDMYDGDVRSAVAIPHPSLSSPMRL